MGTNETIVSSYLLRPVRSYKEAMRDRAAKIQCKGRHHGAGSAGSRCSARRGADDVEPLREKIAELYGLSRADLIVCWIEIHGAAPSKTMSIDLLVRGIAYAIQEQQHGGLTRAEKTALAAMARGNATPTPGHLRPGTRLYRSWRGTTHEVLVLEDGYSWQARTYASLSEVARAITGTRWSGPRFFGLKA